MPKAVKTFERAGAFKCDEETLEAIWQIIREVPKSEPSAEVKTSDNTEITLRDIGELKQFPNSPDRRIEGVTLTSGYKAETAISVNLRGGRSPRIDTRIAGGDKEVLFLHREIWSRLMPLTLWYGKLGMRAYFGSIIILNVLVSYLTKGRSIEETVVYVTIGCSSVITITLIPYHQYPAYLLFPSSSFLVGAGKGRWRASERARTVLFGGIVLALAVSIIGSYIFENYIKVSAIIHTP